jgi:predicted DNA-binding transcriptional regulator AlpA
MPSNTPILESVACELLTLDQTAALCNVSPRTLWAWARSGAAPAPLKIGKGTVRYSRHQYQEWILAGCPRVDGAQQSG